MPKRLPQTIRQRRHCAKWNQATGEQARADAECGSEAGSQTATSRQWRRWLWRGQAIRHGAEKLAGELDKAFPLDTLVQRYWLPTIRAAVALQRKDPNRAVELLKGNEPDRAGPAHAVNVFLCPVYLRGEAYLMLHDGKAAAAEFQKFIDHYGLVVNFPWGALARLGLARAYALEAATDPPPATKRAPRIRISSPSGKTPIPTSPSYKKPRPSMRS